MSEVIRRFAAALACLSVLACGPDRDEALVETGEWGSVLDTLPSGVVVSRTPKDIVTPSTFHFEEQFRIGRAEGDGPETFGLIQALGVDGMDRVYIVDVRSKVLRVFDDGGSFVRSIGREGRGPGEFIEPTGIAWEDDRTFWVVDVQLGRYSVFDSSGTFVRDVRRPPLGFQWPWPGRFHEGYLIESDVPRGLVSVSAASGRVVDTFVDPLESLPVGAAAASYTIRRGSSVRMVFVPFAPRSIWVLDGSGNYWQGHGGEYRIVRRTVRGDTSLVIERDVARPQVTGAERDAAIQDLGPPESLRRVDLSRIPDIKPVFQQILPTPDGGVWLIREGEGDGWLVDIFNVEGRFVGSASLPVEPAFPPVPVVQNGNMWLMVADSFDVPVVAKLRLVRE